MAITLTDPSTNAVQPMSLPLGSEPLRRNKSIPAIKTDSGPVSLFGQAPHLVVSRNGTRDPLAVYNGPKSLPVRKKSKVKPEKAVRCYNSSDGRVVKVSASGAVDLGLIPSRVKNQ